jgi:hypothetical protein
MSSSSFSYVARDALVTERILREKATDRRNFRAAAVDKESDVQAPEEKDSQALSESSPQESKWSLPQTSAQEIGWFTRVLEKDGRCGLTPGVTDAGVALLRRPIRHSDLSQYMSRYWKFYPANPNLLRGASNPSVAHKPKPN